MSITRSLKVLYILVSFYEKSTEQLSPFPSIYFWSHIVQGDIVRLSYCQATPHPLPELGASSRGKGISGIALTTDLLVNHNYLLNKQTQFPINRDSSRIFDRFLSET